MITTKERAQLKNLAQNLKPTLNVGKENIGENTLHEIENYLNKNELMKIKILQNSSLSSKELMNYICEKVGCEPVLVIGKVIVIYKKSNDKKVKHIL